MLIGIIGVARRIASRLNGQFGQRMPLAGMGAGLLMIVLFAIGTTVWDQRQTALADAWANTDNLAIVLAEQTSRSVQAVDIVLRDIQERIAVLGVGTPEEFRGILRTKEFHEFLRSRAERLSQVDNIALVGADGMRVNYSLDWPAPAVDMSDREYSRHFSAHDDPGLFVSEPVVSRATGAWTLYLVRRVNGPHGDFLGMILGSVPLKVFANLYQSINLPRGESFLLLRRDGTVLVRHPDISDWIGTRIPDSSPWYARVAQGGGHFESPGVFDSTKRLVAVQMLHDYPLVMDVGASSERALAHWRSEATLILLGTVVMAACLILLLRALQLQFGRLQTS